jgi:hypothetical protein
VSRGNRLKDGEKIKGKGKQEMVSGVELEEGGEGGLLEAVPLLG